MFNKGKTIGGLAWNSKNNYTFKLQNNFYL